MNLKTILVSTPWFTPAYLAGGPIQSIRNMVGLLQDSYRFKIITSDIDYNNQQLEVRPNEWVNFNQATDVYYSSTRHFMNARTQGFIYDSNVILINGVYDLAFNFKFLRFRKKIRTIISARGMLHPGALSQKKFKKKFYLHIWKLIGIHKTCEFHASTELEKNYIKDVFGKNTIVHVANNFPRIFSKAIQPIKHPGKLELISIALVSPMKNHLFVLQALKHCTQKINYSIYGAIKDVGYWKQCEDFIKEMPTHITVTYRGDLKPDEVERTLSLAHVFILPSKSENFGHAFYEALTAGRPLITSDKTPWNNLESAHAGINTQEGNIKEIIEAIDKFASMTQDELEIWRNGANAYAQQAIDIDEIKEQYHKMFNATKFIRKR